MNKKILILLLLGHSLSALAMPDDEITLKLDNELSSEAAESVSAPTQNSSINSSKPANTTVIIKTGSSAAIRLKLSAGSIDESRIGKISAGERTLLLAKQKLLHADDKMSRSLSMQNKVKPLQAEPKAIKSQLAKSAISPATATLSQHAPPATTAPSAVAVAALPSLKTANTPESRSPRSEEQPDLQQDNPDLQNGLLAALILVLAIPALRIGSRYYTRIRSRFAIESQQRVVPIMKPADDIAKPADDVAITPGLALSPIAKTSAKTPSYRVKRGPAPAAIARIKARTARNESPLPTPPKVSEQVSEENSMPEQAGLYVPPAQPLPDVLPSPAIRNEAIPASQPALQEEDNFLADFDPKRNGNVNEFLASRNAVTLEQIIGWSKYRPASRQLALRIVGSPASQM